MVTQTHILYEFLLAQQAAESYLDGVNFLTEDELFRLRLRNGSNHYLYYDQLEADGELGATQMTDVMIDDFFATWEVIDHLPNTNSGFSATVLRNKNTGEFTLSFRSTESKLSIDGGDYDRDSAHGANGQIKNDGFAYGQLLDMEEYYAYLQSGDWTDSPGLDALKTHLDNGGQINITGYSLGGHLAQLFTLLHYDDVLHTYTFNGAGFGEIDSTETRNEIASALFGKLEQLRQAMTDPFTYLSEVSDEEFAEIGFPALQTPTGRQEALNRLLNERNNEYTNIYLDPLFQYALRTLPDDTTGVGVEPLFSYFGFGTDLRTDDAKITNLFGNGGTGDGEFVAGSGQIFGDFTGIFIEDQPDITDIPPLELDGFLRAFGDTHSISLIADSLAVMDLFQTLDNSLSLGDLSNIFSASSNARADTILGKADGDSLENVLNALGKLFFPENWMPSTIDDAVHGFKNLENRNEFYANIDELRNEILDSNNIVKEEYQGLTITPLLQSDPANKFKIRAQGLDLVEPADAIAYRYALVNLNPFVITGNSDLYEENHNLSGELNLFDPETDEGTLTEDYLTDRAAFLHAKIIMATENTMIKNINTNENITYNDLESGLVLHDIGLGGAGQLPGRLFTFGGADDDPITGGTKDDHLYGGGGVDTVDGQSGNDYLEGNQGEDVLIGGTGNDTLFGGQDNDILWGGANDGTDDNAKDELKGGSGNDTYHVGNLDVIEDSDRSNQNALIDFNGIDVRGEYVLKGGNLYENESTGLQLIVGDTDAQITYRDNDGKITFFTINNFKDAGQAFNNGDFGITLSEPTEPVPTQTYTNTDDTFTIREFNLVDNGDVISGPYEQAIGNDNETNYIGSLGYLSYHELINVDLSPGFVVKGGLGNDWIRVDLDYTPYIVGHTYEPVAGGPGTFAKGVTLYGEEGNDILQGGLDDDRLYGGTGDDLLRVWDGNDILNGGSGNDVMGSNDYFYGRNQMEGTNFDVTADDFYFGDSGEDFISDNWGNDTALGGDGSDFIATGSGSDILIGGDGNDALYGDAKFSVLFGQQGWSFNFNANGQPVSINLTGMTYNGEGEQPAGDYIDGGKGNDFILGGAGDDTLLGGDNNDTINGQDDDDYIDGGDGNDLLFGGDGFDVIEGGTGMDELHGEAGGDFLEGGDNNDILYGDDGEDDLFGGQGEDRLYGGNENDHLDGGADNDELHGEAGDDTLFGGSGRDDLYGGDNNDTLDGGADADNVYGEAGNDTLIAGSGDTLDGGAGDDTYQIGAGVTDIQVIDSSGDDTIEFAEGVTFDDLALNRENGNVTIIAGDTTLTINDWSSNTFERLLFSDGSEVTGQDVEDAINDAPEIGTPIENQSLETESLFTFTIPGGTFNDIDGDTLTFTATDEHGDALPGWLSFDDSTLTFSGTPDTTDAGSVGITVRAVDAGGLSVANTFYLDILPRVNDQVAAFNPNDIDGENGVLIQSIDNYSTAPYPRVLGDINGDGLGDLLILDERQGHNYVVFGQNGGFGTHIDLNNIDGSNGFELLNISFISSRFNAPSLVVGDFTGDGISDAVIDGRLLEGSTGGFSSQVDLLTLPEFTPPVEPHRNIGDFNGDGFDDYFVNPNYIVFGDADGVPADIDVGSLAPGDAIEIQGILGLYQTPIVDVNNDGLADVIIHESEDSFGSQNIIYGNTNPAPVINLDTDLDGITGSKIEGFFLAANNPMNIGESLDVADVNNDGIDDLLIGTSQYLFDEWTDFPVGAVLYGNSNGFGSEFHLDALDGDNGFLLLSPDIFSGYDVPIYVLNAGDINGDGIDDVLVHNTNYTNSYVVYGSSGTNNGVQVGTIGDDIIILDTESDQTVYAGAGNDLIRVNGYLHNDSGGTITKNVFAGTGNDTVELTLLPGSGISVPGYVFNLSLGPGSNTVTVGSNVRGVINIKTPTSIGDINRMKFSGVNSTDYFLGLGSLKISLPDQDLTVHIAAFNPDDASGSLHGIDVFEFSDGVELTYDELLAKGFDLDGTDGADNMTGTNLVDRMSGYAGDDILSTGDGNDVLNGGTGNDSLAGGTGDDTYIYNISDGQDVINDIGGIDQIIFGDGLNSSDLQVTRDDDDLAIELNTEDSITISGWFTNPDQQIESFHFSDNTVLSNSEIEALIVTNRAPIIDAGITDQEIDENNAFIFTIPVDAFSDPDVGDTLTYGVSSTDGSVLPNWLSFDPDIQTFSGTPDFVDYGDLAVRVTATDSGGLSTYVDFTLTVHVPGAIIGTDGDNTLIGTNAGDTLLGLGGNDTIKGKNNNDRLGGGEGNNTLDGGNGDDLLIAGSGDDSLDGGNGDDILNAGDGNNTLDGGNGDDQLIAGSGDDSLDGGNGKDQLIAGAGNDFLYGDNGNDILDGGVGNDLLAGGNGNDSYQFNLGYGQDTITERNGSDRVNLDGVDHEQLWFWQAGNDLRLGILGTQDWLTVDDWYENNNSRVETFQTTDDQFSLYENQVQQLVQAMAGFNPETQGDLNVPQEDIDIVQTTIAAAWQSA